MALSKDKRYRQRSAQILESAVQSGDPFKYLFLSIDEWNSLSVEDIMKLLRQSPPIDLTSHDIVDAWERNMHREHCYLNIVSDLAQLLRNRMVDNDEVSKQV